MKTNPTSVVRTISIACALAIVASYPVSGAVSDILEQGIYAEETKGNLDEAITLYRKALAEGKTSQSASAQAQFRLGQCYLKKSRTADAIAAFQKLIDEFPNEKELVAKAKEFLPGKLTLLPVSWQSGERLKLNLLLPTGLDVGTMIYYADLVEVNGARVWHVGARVSAVGSQSFSDVSVDPETFRPASSRWNHVLLGDVTATYGAESVSIERAGTADSKKIPLSGPVYDNEEAVHLMRRLPLADGYKTTIPIFVSFSGATIPMGVEVTGPESVTVKAGKFDCFKLQLSISQTFWISADAKRLLVKFEAGGAVAELASVTQYKAGEPAVYDDSELGVKMVAPSGWAFHRHSGGKSKAQIINLLPPSDILEDAWLKVAPLSSLNAAEKVSPRALADASLAEFTRELKNSQIDQASWKNLWVNGRPAMGCVVNYTDNGKEMAAYGVFSIGTSNAEQFSLMVPRDKLAACRPVFDSIIASYRCSR